MTDSSINSSCRRGNEHTNRCKKKKKKLGDNYKWPRDAASIGKQNPWQNRKWRLMPTRKHGLRSHTLKDTVTLRLSQHPNARNCICSFSEKCKVRLQVQRWLQNKIRCVPHARTCVQLAICSAVKLSLFTSLRWHGLKSGCKRLRGIHKTPCQESDSVLITTTTLMRIAVCCVTCLKTFCKGEEKKVNWVVKKAYLKLTRWGEGECIACPHIVTLRHCLMGQILFNSLENTCVWFCYLVFDRELQVNF